MDAWVKLAPDHDGDAVWRRFLDAFPVSPFVPRDASGVEPAPSITYSIMHAFESDLDSRDFLEDDLNRKTLAALQRCTRPEQQLYVFEWRHDAWMLYPHRPFDAADWRAWRVPVLPERGYYIFTPEDVAFCLFADCVTLTICVYGQALMDAYALDLPYVFSHVVRMDGKPT